MGFLSYRAHRKKVHEENAKATASGLSGGEGASTRELSIVFFSLQEEEGGSAD